MVWFKIDDGFATSEPVMRVPRRYRASVIGLWTLSGTWCAKELTDGRLPAHMLEELAGTPAQARMLIECGLWASHPDGYVFIGWGKYNPTRAEVMADRAAVTERKRKSRQSQGESRVTPAPVTQESHTRHDPPTRPDPTRPITKESRKSLGGITGEEPPLFCDLHNGNPTPGPCSSCGDARRLHDAWARAQKQIPTNRPPTGAQIAATMCHLHTDYPRPCGLCQEIERAAA